MKANGLHDIVLSYATSISTEKIKFQYFWFLATFKQSVYISLNNFACQYTYLFIQFFIPFTSVGS
jgi:hypothetical protein